MMKSGWWPRAGRLRLSGNRLHPANRYAMMGTVNASTDRYALVPAGQLDDLLELSRMAVDRLPDTDPLTSALRGATAQVRVAAVLEPGR